MGFVICNQKVPSSILGVGTTHIFLLNTVSYTSSYVDFYGLYYVNHIRCVILIQININFYNQQINRLFLDFWFDN
jgi:hypothetical protein